MSMPARRLGRGLSSLISTEISADSIPTKPTSQPPVQPVSVDESTPPVASGAAALQLIPIAAVRANPSQPRKQFDEADLSALAASLKSRGALQPILVRRSGNGFELVAGERRLRAAKLAGLTELPAIVRTVPDADMLELALIENVQRTDLGAVERARAYRAMQERYGLSHEQIAERMGEDRVTVTNYIRLLGLAAAVLERIEDKSLNMGQARALLGLADPRRQVELAERVAREGWSVRRVEAEVRRLSEAGKGPEKKSGEAARPVASDAARRLTELLGTRVEVREGRRRHTGKLMIEYYSLDDFERITGRLGLSGE